MDAISIYKTITSPILPTTDIEDMFDIRRFRKFIQNFLAFTVDPDYDPRADMTTPEFMRHWIDAFTHDSIDAHRNYQVLEFLGDGDLKAAFKQYLFQYHRVESEHVFTTINNLYMSKRKQPEISRRMNFDKWVRVSPDIEKTAAIVEDTMESVFGALSLIGRKLYLSNRGLYYHPQELILRFFVAYFTANPINIEEEGTYVYKSTLIDFYKFFTGEVTNPRVEKTTGMIQLTDKFFEGLQSHADSVKIRQDITREIKSHADSVKIGQDITREIKSLRFEPGTTEEEQAEKIMKVLIKNGMDREWYTEANKNISFKGDSEIEALAKSNGYTRFVLKPYYQGKTKYYKLVAQYIEEKGNFKRAREENIKILPATSGFKQQARRVLLEKFSSR